ncbi:MAG: hypothetical protein HC900_11755, partial [Methylacidiphilales bacterium]|nr:hypothetical protein [Candidatus Methylacidiphilales bacterium]
MLRQVTGKAFGADAGQTPVKLVRQCEVQDPGQSLLHSASSGTLAAPVHIPNENKKTKETVSRQAGGVSKSDELAESDETSDPNVADPAEALPIAFPQLPHLVRSPAGDVLDGLMVDYYAYVGDKLILSGWVVGVCSQRRIEGEDDAAAVRACLFPRPDVETAFPVLAASARGLLAVVKPGAGDTFTLC